MSVFNKLALTIFGIIFASSLVGFASAQELDKGKYKLESFVVELPTTSGWEDQSEPNYLNLGRTLGNPLYTFTLSARQYPLMPEAVASVSDLQVFVTKAAEKEAQTLGRYQLTTHSENQTSRLGMECVEYQKSWIDHGGEITQYKRLHMMASGLICIHPESAYRLIEISYSIRNSSGLVPEEIKKEGEIFINSLKARKSGQN